MVTSRGILTTALIGASCLSSIASACVMEDGPPPPTWWLNKGPSPIPNFTRQELYMNVGLFPPTAPTNCACGFGFAGSSTVAPALVPLDASVVILNRLTCQPVGVVAAFDPLVPNGTVGADLNNPQLYPAGAGATWFGFGGAINPFVPPQLGPNEVFAICFSFDVPDAIDPLFKQGFGWVAAGVADANFHPIFQGEHAVGAPFGCAPISPTPGSAVLLGMGGVLALKRRRK